MLAESSYGQGDSGFVEERFLCTKSDILSATKCFEVGLTRKSITGTGPPISRLNEHQFAERLFMPAIPDRPSGSKQHIRLCCDCCPRLSGSSSYDLFVRTASALSDEISSFVVRQPQFVEDWPQSFL